MGEKKKKKKKMVFVDNRGKVIMAIKGYKVRFDKQSGQ